MGNTAIIKKGERVKQLLNKKPNATLQALTRMISEEFFHKDFNHIAYFNNRLRTTGGRYHLESHNIDINPKMYTEHGLETLVGTIKHELCHYHLHMNGINDGHGSQFKALLKAVGGTRYAPKPVKYKEYSYFCKECGCKYTRHRKIDASRYACSLCGGDIELRLILTKKG